MKNLNIIHETSAWLVIDKPAGISVHNDKINVLSILKQQKKNPKISFHAVHRLDSETSGILLIAKDPEVATKLMEEMQKESTHRLYQALLRGPMKEDQAHWNWKLSDKAEGRKNPQGLSKDRKECESLIKVIQKNEHITLVECETVLSQQHQIRKHAAIAEHPVVGDKRYNDPKYNLRIAKMFGTERMFLHATELRIKLSGRDVVFTSALPNEFKSLLKV